MGVAIALLQLLREVAAGVEKIDRRESVGREGGSITTPKQGVAIEAWWQRGSLKSPTKIEDPLCKVKYGASSGGLPNDRLNYRFNLVAATNYKTGDTKRRTDQTIMIWSSFATERSLIL
jgi:hypothetical protein